MYGNGVALWAYTVVGLKKNKQGNVMSDKVLTTLSQVGLSRNP
jgi:hypothetical protein